MNTKKKKGKKNANSVNKEKRARGEDPSWGRRGKTYQYISGKKSNVQGT